MKPMNFVLFASLCLLIIMASTQKSTYQDLQVQEIQQEQEGPSQATDLPHLLIVYRVPSHQEEPIADILWLKKAANAAVLQGGSYFNVLQHQVNYRYHPTEELYLSIVRGVIELEHDPMAAEYDAHAILNLPLENP